jgi:hypothetical protein
MNYLRNNAVMLVDPVYTSRRASKCATVSFLLGMTKEWLSDYPDRVVFWLSPQDTSLIKNDLTIFDDDKRIIKVPIDYTFDRYREMWMPSRSHTEAIKEFGGSHGCWDILLTTRNSGAYYRHVTKSRDALSRFMCLSDRFPVLAFKSTIPVSDDTYGIKHRSWCFNTLFNYTMFDLVMVSAEFERKGILTAANRYLSYSEISLLRNKLVVSNADSFVDPSFPLSDACERKFISGLSTVVYPQRISIAQRQFPKIYRVLRAIHSNNNDITVRVLTNSISIPLPTSIKVDLKFLHVDKMPREKFLEYMQSVHIFVSASVEEGLPNAIVEATKNGVIGVILKAKWSLDFFGSDYPFMVGSESDILGAVNYIHANKQSSFLKWRKWYSEYFLPRLSSNETGYDLFINRSNAFLDSLDSDFLIGSTAIELDNNARKKRVKRINLINIGEGLGIDPSRAKDQRVVDHSMWRYFRLPWRYSVSVSMRKLGWKLCSEPWVVKSPH